MRAERILENKKTFLEIFTFLFAAIILIFLYRIWDPYSFPGIEDRALPVLSLLGVFVLLLYLPYGKIREALEFISLEYRRYRIKRQSRSSPHNKIRAIELTVDYVEKLVNVLSASFDKVGMNQAEYFRAAVGIVFQVTLVIFLLLLLIQQIIPKMPLDPNYLLLPVIIFGIIHVLVSRHDEVKKEPATRKDYILACVMGAAGALIVWYKVQNTGALSYIISAISGILIILLSILMLQDEQ